MVAQAKRSYTEGQGATFLRRDFVRDGLPGRRHFDQIILLGNTLPHIQTKRDLDTLMKKAADSLNSGGVFVIQTVNAGVLYNKQVHFLPARVSESYLFAPVYIRRGSLWEFRMPIYELRAAEAHIIEMPATMLRFWSITQVTRAARSVGLKQKKSLRERTIE